MSATLLSFHHLGNYEVYDREGNKLGVIDDLMLDIDGANVRYAVLAAKSVLGRSKKTYAVPLSALQLDTENECFMLDVDRDLLARSAGFDADSPPELPDPLFAQRQATTLDVVTGLRGT